MEQFENDVWKAYKKNVDLFELMYALFQMMKAK